LEHELCKLYGLSVAALAKPAGSIRAAAAADDDDDNDDEGSDHAEWFLL